MSEPPDQKQGDLQEDVLEVFRHTPSGTNDPNIVGNVGPFDVPPGSDPREPGEFDDERSEPFLVLNDDDEQPEDGEFDYE